VNNQKAFDFYFGNDSGNDFEERLPSMASDLEDIGENGVYANLASIDDDDDDDDNDDNLPIDTDNSRVHVRIGLRFRGI
jgi:hypothetical protein